MKVDPLSGLVHAGPIPSSINQPLELGKAHAQLKQAAIQGQENPCRFGYLPTACQFFCGICCTEFSGWVGEPTCPLNSVHLIDWNRLGLNCTQQRRFKIQSGASPVVSLGSEWRRWSERESHRCNMVRIGVRVPFKAMQWNQLHSLLGMELFPTK